MEHTGGVQIYHPSMLAGVLVRSLCAVLIPLSLLSQDDCHTNWVSCVRFSPNAQNPVIVSCGWDKLVKVGSSLASVSQPFHIIHLLSISSPILVSPSHPQQVWNLTNCKLKTNHFGHNGFLNCVTVSPDGSLCASGGKVRQLVPYGWCALIRIDLHPSPVGWQCYALGLE